MDEGVTVSCTFVSAYDIHIFYAGLPVCSCTVLGTWVIFVISLDTCVGEFF